jgi:hypothetical protein
MGHGRLLGCMKTESRRMLAGLCCGVTLVSSSIASGGVWTTHGPDDGRVNAIAVDPSSRPPSTRGRTAAGSSRAWTPED